MKIYKLNAHLNFFICFLLSSFLLSSCILSPPVIKVDPGDGGGGGGGFVHTIPVMNLDTLNRQLLSSKSIQEIRTHKKLNKSNADRKYDALKEKERERQGLSPQEALGVLERLKKSIGFLKLEAGITNTTAFHETDILKQAQIKLLESISYIKIPILFAEYIHLKDEDDNDNKKEQMMSARTARELMRLYGLESIVTQQDFQDGDFKSQVAISNYGELAPSISGFHPTTCVNYDNDIHFMKVSYRYFYPFGHIKQKHHQAAQQGNSFAQNNITHQVIDLSSAPISTLNRLIQNKFNTQCQHKINAYLKKMDVERSTHTTYQEARRNALNKARGIQSRYDDIKQRIRDLKTNQMFKQCRNIKCLLRQIKSKKKRLKKNKFIYRPVFKATSNNVRNIKTSIKRLLEDNILPKLNEDVNHHIISTLETMSQNKYQKEQNASNFKFSVHEFKIYWYSEENTVGIIAYFDLEFTPEITKIVRVGTHRLTFIPIKSNQLGKFFLAETETSMALLEQFIQENELERRDINKTCLKNKRKKYSAKKYLSMPASCVSVAGLEKFIEWVRAKTKKNIVIPSCKQWRHVASHGGDYSYCGRHNPCQGRKCTDNIGGSRQIGVRSARKTQIPRFYEMCGNVTEACVDEKDGVYLQIGPSVGSDFEEQEFSDNFDLYEFGAYATNGFRLAIDKK